MTEVTDPREQSINGQTGVEHRRTRQGRDLWLWGVSVHLSFNFVHIRVDGAKVPYASKQRANVAIYLLLGKTVMSTFRKDIFISA
jgi:hypothetical protein